MSKKTLNALLSMLVTGLILLSILEPERFGRLSIFVLAMVVVGQILYYITCKKISVFRIGLCLSALIIISSFPLATPDSINETRFSRLEDEYNERAQQIVETLADAPDTMWEEYAFNSFTRLSCGNAVYYKKLGTSIAIYFPVWVTFFNSYGYVYFTDNTARDFYEHPSQYFSGLSSEKAYDCIDPINSNWAAIKIY